MASMIKNKLLSNKCNEISNPVLYEKPNDELNFNEKKDVDINFFLKGNNENHILFKKKNYFQEMLNIINSKKIIPPMKLNENLKTQISIKNKVYIRVINRDKKKDKRNNSKIITSQEKNTSRKFHLNISERVISLNKTESEFKIMNKDVFFNNLLRTKAEGAENRESKGKFLDTDFIDYKHKKDLIDIFPRLHETAKAIYHSLKNKNPRIFENYKISYEIKYPKFNIFLSTFEGIYKKYFNSPVSSLDLKKIYDEIKFLVSIVNQEKKLGFEFQLVGRSANMKLGNNFADKRSLPSLSVSQSKKFNKTMGSFSFNKSKLKLNKSDKRIPEVNDKIAIKSATAKKNDHISPKSRNQQVCNKKTTKQTFQESGFHQNIIEFRPVLNLKKIVI